MSDLVKVTKQTLFSTGIMGGSHKSQLYFVLLTYEKVVAQFKAMSFLELVQKYFLNVCLAINSTFARQLYAQRLC